MPGNAAGRMTGKVVFVTGAARGQGRAHCVRLAEEGADLIAVDVPRRSAWMREELGTVEQLAETASLVRGLGQRIVHAPIDVRDRAELAAFVTDAARELGGLHGVVANAAIVTSSTPLEQIPEDQWHDMLDVDLTGVWNTFSAAIPHLIEQGSGSIVATASGAASKATTGMAAYNASKAGVVALTLTAARELARHRIRANAICPGTVGTDMVMNDTLYRSFRPNMEHPTLDDIKPMLQRMHLIPEPWVDPIDIANAALFLLSDESRYVTGTTMYVDLGGNLK